MWPASTARPSEMSVQRVGDGGEAAALLEAERRPGVAPCAERRARRAERAGDDEQVAGPGAGAAGHALRAADARSRRARARGALVVSPPTTGTPGSFRPCVELEHVVELGLARRAERDEERLAARRPRRRGRSG